MILLSVIIPVYNAEKSLPTCLDSLLAYSGNELEVIVVDDGSFDDSGAICEQYAAQDSRVKIYHQANAGVSAARNLGLQHATGEWISFVDADDEVLPGYVEACIEREHPADVAYFAHEGYRLKAGYYTTRSEMEAQILELKRNAQGFEFYGYTWNKFFRASIIREHQLRFPKKLNHREDEYFTTEYMHYAQSLEILEGPLYRYRIDNVGEHLTQRKLPVQMLFLLAHETGRQVAYWEASRELRAYEVYRALYMYCEALLGARMASTWRMASEIVGFVHKHEALIDPQQYPYGFVKCARKSQELLFWLFKRKLRK